MTTTNARIDATVLAGGRVRCTVTFTPIGASSPADPASVVFKTKVGSGNVTTYTYGTDAEVVKSSTGVYYLDVVTADSTATSQVRVKVKGSTPGAISAVAELAIQVKGTVIA